MKAAIVAQAGSMPVYGDFNEPVPVQRRKPHRRHRRRPQPCGEGPRLGSPLQFAGRLPLCRRHRRRRTARRRPPRLFHPAAGALRQHGGDGPPCLHRNACRLPDGLDDITAAAIANPGLSSWAALKERARLARGRNRADQRRDRNVRPSGRSDRQALGAEEGHRTGRNAAALQALKALGADETILLGRKYRCARCRLQGAFRGRRRRRARLSLGQKRRAPSDCRRQGRTGGRPDPLRPGRQRQRRQYHLAGRGAAFGHRSSSWEAVSAASRSIALSERSRNCCRPPSTAALKSRPRPFHCPKSNRHGPATPASAHRIHGWQQRQMMHRALLHCGPCALLSFAG